MISEPNDIEGPPRVLLVDDEPDLLEPVRFCLEQEGYDVRTACNGYEALGLVRAWTPRLVLLDVMMPGENGYRVSRFVKEDVDAGRFPPVAIVLVTARRPDDPERADGLMSFSRADAVIYKPFELDEILEQVHRHAGRVACPTRR